MKSFLIAFFTSLFTVIVLNILFATKIVDMSLFLPKTDAKVGVVKDFAVPNLLNLNKQEAGLVCTNLGIKSNFEMEPTKHYLNDIVMKQYPLPGFRIRKGEVLKLTIAQRTNGLVIPDIKGLLSTDAVELLKNNGLLNVSKKYQNSKEVSKSHVISVFPSVGEEVKKNDRIEILISLGQKEKKEVVKYTIMPNLYNSTLNNAKIKLQNSGLKLGQIIYTTDEEKAFDKVISQSTRKGKRIPKGTTITVTVNVEANER